MTSWSYSTWTHYDLFWIHPARRRNIFWSGSDPKKNVQSLFFVTIVFYNRNWRKNKIFEKFLLISNDNKYSGLPASESDTTGRVRNKRIFPNNVLSLREENYVRKILSFFIIEKLIINLICAYLWYIQEFMPCNVLSVQELLTQFIQ